MKIIARTLIGIVSLGAVASVAFAQPHLSAQDRALKERVVDMARIEIPATATTTKSVKFRTIVRSDRVVSGIPSEIKGKYPNATERLERRTKNSRAYVVGSTTVTEIYAGNDNFVEKGGTWYETDIQMLDEAQGKRIAVARGPIAYAQTTYFPSMDGYVFNDSIALWSNARGASSGTSASDSSASVDGPIAGLYTGTYTVRRLYFLFDTSAITDTDTITAATLSVYTASAAGPNADSTSVEVVQTSPASNTALVTGDFSAVTFTSGGTLALSSIPGGAYFDMVMNATGRGWVNKTGITKLGLIIGRDLSNTAPTGGNQLSNVVFSEQAGTSLDPKLIVTSVAGATPSFGDIILFN